jgi:hypothetical protein
MLVARPPLHTVTTRTLAARPGFVSLRPMPRPKPTPRLLATLALLAATVAAPARADDTAAIPFAKLAEFNNAFATVPPAQRDKVRLIVQLAHADKASHAPIRAWVDTNGTRTDSPVAPEGTISISAPVTRIRLFLE